MHPDPSVVRLYVPPVPGATATLIWRDFAVSSSTPLDVEGQVKS